MSTTDLAPIAQCPSCGADLEPGARFCSNCGRAIDTESPPPEPTYWSDSPTQWSSSAPSASIPSLTAAFDSNEGGIGKLFSGSGRIGRLEYFLTIVGVWVMLAIAWGLISVVDAAVLTLVLGLGSWLVSLVVSVCAGVKRLHDFDQTGWLYLIFLVPFAGFIMFFVLLLKGGSIGLNKYGYADSGSVQG